MIMISTDSTTGNQLRQKGLQSIPERAPATDILAIAWRCGIEQTIDGDNVTLRATKAAFAMLRDEILEAERKCQREGVHAHTNQFEGETEDAEACGDRP